MKSLMTNIAALGMVGCIALVMAGCGGGGALSKAEEEALQQQLEDAQAKAAAEEAARKAAEAEAAQEAAARRAAEAEAAQAEADRAAEAEAAAAAAAEAQKLREEEEARVAELNLARAKAAFDGLGGALATGSRSDPDGDATMPTVTPRYGQTTDVTATPTGGSAVDFASKRRSSSGRWSITTLSNAGTTHNDDLVVYSDIGGPTRVLFTEHATYSTLFSAVTNTNNIRATLTGNAHPIASSQFPGGARTKPFTHTIDSDPSTDADGDNNPANDYDTTRFGGTFAGASGTFECTGTCTVAHEGGSIYNLNSGTWTFTTGNMARAPVADDSYMYFGWWTREQKSDGSLEFEMFSGGEHEAGAIPVALTGTATYTGPAVGQYAIYQPLGTQTVSGSFTARAELTANFGTATAEGTLSGQVTNFSNASDWSVTLKSETITTGAVTDGDVSWTIGSDTEDGGMWDAAFFDDVDGFTGYPQGVSGTFDARFTNVGRLIGAFGARCPTSTCPAN